MNHSALIHQLDSLLPEIRAAGAPEEVLLKHARENNFYPAQLEKLAQLFNTAKTLTVMDKSAGDRGREFTIIDVPSLVGRFVEPRVEKGHTKSAAAEPSHDTRRFPGRNIAPIVKEAAAAAPEETPFEKRAREQNEDRDLQTLEQIIDDHREKGLTHFVKLAWMVRSGVPFADIEEDAGDLLGDEGRETVEHFSAYLDSKHIKHARMTTPTRRALAVDRHQVMPIFKQACEAYGLAKAASSMAGTHPSRTRSGVPAGLSGRRGGATGVPQALADRKGNSKGKLSGGSDKPSDSKPSGGGEKQDFGKLMDNFVQRPVQGVTGPYQALKGVLGELKGRNSRQEKVDTAGDDAQAVSGLQRLLVTDPILQKADPDTVVDLYNSFRQADPETAKDVNSMRFALREALQYGALPQHTLKEILSGRKERAQAIQAERGNDDALYAS